MPRSIRDDAKISAFVFAALALAACSEPQQSRVYDRDPALPDDLPFSSAVVAGDAIYLSGEIGREPGATSLVEGGVGAQTAQIFENIEATLKRLDADLGDVVKCTVFLDDMNEYAAMNAAYSQAFPGDKPARSTLGADGLAMGAGVEIECLAVRR